jgi:hypothetical protein
MSKRGKRLLQELGHLLQRYARKAHKGWDPNDRDYDRELEALVKRMRPEDFDRLLRDEPDPEEFHRFVSLSLQRALLGEITEDILAVSLETAAAAEPHRAVIRAYVRPKSAPELPDDLDAAMAEILAEFPIDDWGMPEVELQLLECKDTAHIHTKGQLVFVRKGLRVSPAA